MLLNELRKQDQQVARLSAHAESADRQIAELKAGQEAQRIAFQRKLATIERELAQPGNSGKLAAAFQP
jgi:ABC-type iron transport system FetAB ATPase subunit